MRWRYVGWYSSDPHDPHLRPVSVTGFVNAPVKSEAFDKADEALVRMEKASGMERLNWYVKAAPRD